jgi:hypothetical protein
MDVHPTKNVSIGIDPYPYDLNLNCFKPKLSTFGENQAMQGDFIYQNGCNCPFHWQFADWS